MIARIVSSAMFIKYYASGRIDSSLEFEVGLKTSIVANYFNMIMGFFQVASILELFFVCGSIQ